jgi:NADP-dependent 3-hydroxy acid dehydrogenase YdfG
MNLHLDKKIIVVTGGAKGIGEGIVKALDAENAVPVIVGRKETDNLKTLESIGNKGFQVVAELTEPEECGQAIKKIIKKYNRIDGLVNNASVNDGVGLENGNYEDFITSLHKN